AEAVGTAAGQDGQQVVVRALHEGRRPAAVHVPEQDPHAKTSCGTRPLSRSAAATTAAGGTSVRHGWPGTGQLRARLPEHAACWSPRTTVGTPCGAHRAAGTTGANSDT